MTSRNQTTTHRLGTAISTPPAERDRPLGGYAALTGTFLGLSAAFATWLARSKREVPERPGLADAVLVSVATHKMSRMVTRDRVTSTIREPFTEYQGDAGHGEVDEKARGHGLRRAVGELLVCPYCLALWVAAGFTAALLVVPRAARWVAFVFTAVTASDLLQIAYRKATEIE